MGLISGGHSQERQKIENVLILHLSRACSH